MVHETPQIYRDIVVPYILSFPPVRTQWSVSPSHVILFLNSVDLCRVLDILSGKSEAEKIVYASPGFIILPDMKWDLSTLSALYLVAIVRASGIRSLRDLRKCHLALLKDIRNQVTTVVHQRWGIAEGGLRMFIHYQPSYCTYLSWTSEKANRRHCRPLPRSRNTCIPNRIYGHESRTGASPGRCDLSRMLACLYFPI
jgi:m7GpppX diphosphatase